RHGIRDLGRAHSPGIELRRSCASDDSVYISHLAEAPETGDKQSLADPGSSLGFEHAGRTEESATRALISAESHKASISDGDKYARWLIRQTDRDFIRPGHSETVFHELAQRRQLKWLSPPDDNSLLPHLGN